MIFIKSGATKATKKSKKQNSGRMSQEMISYVNHLYYKQGKLLCQEIPVPNKVVGRGTKKGQNLSVFHAASTVDFVGLLPCGTYLAFDVKSTTNTKRFELKNIEEHQVSFLKSVTDFNGIGFVLIHFLNDNSWYLVFAGDLYDIYLKAYFQKERKKSLPKKELEKDHYRVPGGKTEVEYLEIIEKKAGKKTTNTR